MKFRAQDNLIWQRWDDEYVVYNPLSGETHHLDYVSAQGLMELEKAGISTEQLAYSLSLALGVPEDDKLKQYARSMIAKFSDFGLTRSV